MKIITTHEIAATNQGDGDVEGKVEILNIIYQYRNKQKTRETLTHYYQQ